MLLPRRPPRGEPGDQVRRRLGMYFSVVICVQTSAYGAADRPGTFTSAALALSEGTGGRAEAGARENRSCITTHKANARPAGGVPTT
jgi:hypothetical protein